MRCIWEGVSFMLSEMPRLKLCNGSKVTSITDMFSPRKTRRLQPPKGRAWQISFNSTESSWTIYTEWIRFIQLVIQNGQKSLNLILFRISTRVLRTLVDSEDPPNFQPYSDIPDIEIKIFPNSVVQWTAGASNAPRTREYVSETPALLWQPFRSRTKTMGRQHSLKSRPCVFLRLSSCAGSMGWVLAGGFVFFERTKFLAKFILGKVQSLSHYRYRTTSISGDSYDWSCSSGAQEMLVSGLGFACSTSDLHTAQNVYHYLRFLFWILSNHVTYAAAIL